MALTGPEPHRHRRVLPELRHEPRMGIGREPVAPDLEPEVVELVARTGDPPRTPARRCPGEAWPWKYTWSPGPVVLAPEEVVEPDLVQGGRAGIGGQVPADRVGPDVRPDHHDRGIPPDEGPDTALEQLVAGKLGLGVGRDGVDVGGGDRDREVDLGLPGPLEHPHEQVPGPVATVDPDHVVERGQPLRRSPRDRRPGAGGRRRRTSIDLHVPTTRRPTARTRRRRRRRRWSPPVAPTGHAGGMDDSPPVTGTAPPAGAPTVVYTDGSCLGNPGPGGWAWAVDDGPVGRRRRAPHHQPADGGPGGHPGARGARRAGPRGQRLDLCRELLPPEVVRRLEAPGLAQLPGQAGGEPRPVGAAVRPGPRPGPAGHVRLGQGPLGRPDERRGRRPGHRGGGPPGSLGGTPPDAGLGQGRLLP